jgi:hypothetical protein
MDRSRIPEVSTGSVHGRRSQCGYPFCRTYFRGDLNPVGRAASLPQATIKESTNDSIKASRMTRWALVTGAGGGIGEGTARVLAADG